LLPHPADCFLRRHAIEHRQRCKGGSRSSSTTPAGHFDNLTGAGAPQSLLQSVHSIQLVSRNPKVRPDDPAIWPRRHRPFRQRQKKVCALIRNLSQPPTPHPSTRRQRDGFAHPSSMPEAPLGNSVEETDVGGDGATADRAENAALPGQMANPRWDRPMPCCRRSRELALIESNQGRHHVIRPTTYKRTRA